MAERVPVIGRGTGLGAHGYEAISYLRTRRRRPRRTYSRHVEQRLRTDVGVAAALLVFAQLEIWLGSGADGQEVETALAAAVMTSALALRRIHPLACLAL